MRVALHQPYLFPYRGYFDLIASVDAFVLGDDYQWIKGGWINRNNFPMPFTFRVKKHSASTPIKKCHFVDVEEDKKRFKGVTNLLADKYLNLLNQQYSVAWNCFRTISAICQDLGIATPIYLLSEFEHGKFVQGILDVMKTLGGDTYVNLPGGKVLYTQEMFGDIKLEFIETKPGPSILCELK